MIGAEPIEEKGVCTASWDQGLPGLDSLNCPRGVEWPLVRVGEGVDGWGVARDVTHGHDVS